MALISEEEFRKLCADIYAEREQIYAFNPQASRRDALLWMLLGCLLSLLSVPADQLPDAARASADPYGDAIREILRGRMSPPFAAEKYLAELARQAAVES